MSLTWQSDPLCCLRTMVILPLLFPLLWPWTAWNSVETLRPGLSSPFCSLLAVRLLLGYVSVLWLSFLICRMGLLIALFGVVMGLNERSALSTLPFPALRQALLSQLEPARLAGEALCAASPFTCPTRAVAGGTPVAVLISIVALRAVLHAGCVCQGRKRGCFCIKYDTCLLNLLFVLPTVPCGLYHPCGWWVSLGAKIYVQEIESTIKPLEVKGKQSSVWMALVGRRQNPQSVNMSQRMFQVSQEVVYIWGRDWSSRVKAILKKTKCRANMMACSHILALHVFPPVFNLGSVLLSTQGGSWNWNELKWNKIKTSVP